MRKTLEKMPLFPVEEFPEVYPERIILSKVPFIQNPQTQNDKLLNLQHDFIINHNQKALGLISEISLTICIKLIKKEIKRNKHLRNLTSEEVIEKAQDSMTRMIEVYLRDDLFFIKDSFTAYLYLCVKYILYHQSEADKIIDFVDMDSLSKLFCLNENQNFD